MNNIFNTALYILFFPFLFLVCFVFLIFNYKIFYSKTIFLGYHWAFGHQVYMLEAIAKNYYKSEKIAIIEVLSLPRNNQYLSKLYHNYYNIYQLSNYNLPKIPKIYFDILKVQLKIINIILPKIKIITYEKFLKNIEKKNKRKTLVYNEITNQIEHRSEHFWMDKLLKKKIIYNFPKKLEKKCKLILKQEGIVISKKIANVFFREKQSKFKKISGKGYYDILRQNYNKNNYIDAIKWLHEKNYTIFIHGTRELNLNKKIYTNVYFVEKFNKNINQKLLNIYLHYIGDFFLSQNSGVVALPSVLKKEIVISDFFLFSGGLPGKMRILFPKIMSKNKLLKLNQYVNTNFFFGKGFDKTYNIIVPNTSKEILNVVKDRRLKKSKKIKFPKYSGIRYRNETRVYY